MIKQRPIIEIEDEVIQDYLDGMPILLIERKYNWSWSTLRNIFTIRKIPRRPHGGKRNDIGRLKGSKNKWGGK